MNKTKIYSCNYKLNNQCPKTHCKHKDGKEGCTNTTQWKYAKRTPLNYIKKIINDICLMKRSFSQKMIKNNTYTLNVDIQTDNALKQLRQIKQEVKRVVKECTYEIKKLKLKRKDILIVKMDSFLKDDDKDRLEKRLKKKLHRKVLVLDNSVKEIEAVNR